MKKSMQIRKFNFVLTLIILFSVNSSNFIASKEISYCHIQSQGTIQGIITDEEGNPLPGVIVTIASKSALFNAISDASGLFSFVNLPPGIYDVKVESAGFKTVYRENVSIALGQSVALKFSMGTADIDETGGTKNSFNRAKDTQTTPTDKKKNNQLPPNQIEKTPPPTLPKIPRLIIKASLGLDPFKKEIISRDKAQWYYFGGNIFAINGIAKVGISEKRLDNITEIPYGDDSYNKNSIKTEAKSIYAIRVVEKDEMKILLVRVLKILEDGIEIEYWLE